MNQNTNKPVLKCGDKLIKASEVNDFLGLSGSDSESSDWEGIKEISIGEFMSDKKVNEPTKKVFERKYYESEKSKKKVVSPFDIVPENTPIIKPNVPVVKDSKYFIVAPTRIRVLNPQLSCENWKNRTESRQVIPASKLCQDKMEITLTDADWILVGVVVQVAIKKDKTDKNFCIWYLNDLQCLDKVIKVMIFREVYEKFWKENIGTVIAILKPKCLPTVEKFKTKAFTVDNSEQIMVLGRSADYGICKGKTKNGENCKNIVNKGECSMCSYHVQSGYFDAMSRPGFGSCSVEKLNERKRKNPSVPWIKDQKKPKMDGVYVNRSNSNVSLEKLQECGITARATGWGLLDKSSVPLKTSNVSTESVKTPPLVNLLKKPSSGSMNLVKHIVEKSMGSSGIVKQSRSLNSAKVPNVCTFEALRKKMAQNPPEPDLSNKSINLGYKPAKLDGASADAYRAELNKLRLAALAKEKGGYAALRESNKKEHIQKVCSSSINKPQKPILDENFLKLLSQGSSNKSLVDFDKMAELDRKLDRIEEVEKLETKLTTQHEQECIVFICVQCQSKTAMKPRFCVVEGHTVKSVKGFRRFFRCIKCKQRTTTYEKYPEGSCLKCGACAYEKTGKMKEREIETEKLQIHGNEKRFINN